MNCRRSCSRQFEDINEKYMFRLCWSCFGHVYLENGVSLSKSSDWYGIQCRSTTAKSAISEIKKVLKEYCKTNIHKKAYKSILAENSTMDKYVVAYYSTHFITYFLPYLRRYIDAVAKSVEAEMMKQVHTVALILNSSDRMKSLPRVKITKSGKIRKVKSPVLDVQFPQGIINLIYSFTFPRVLPVTNSFLRDASCDVLMRSYSVLERAVQFQLQYKENKKELMERYCDAIDKKQTLKDMKEDLHNDVKKECERLLFKRNGRVMLSW